jgi:hypothetical protein
MTTHQPEHEPTEAEIQKAAYYLYLESGCIPGHEIDHWLAAKELLRHHHGRDGGRSRRPFSFSPSQTSTIIPRK